MKKKNNISLSIEELDTIRNLLQIHRKKWFYKKQRQKALLEELHNLDGTNNIRILKHMLLFALDRDKRVSEAASDITKRIMMSFDHRDFIDLNQLFRSSWYYYDLESVITKMDMQEVIRYINSGHANKYVISLMTFHGNGYIREKGLESLENFDFEFTLICSVLRINDWVPAIRQLSKRILSKLLVNDENVSIVLKNIPLIDRISNWSRENHSEILNICSNRYIEVIDNQETKDLLYSTDNLYLRRALYDKYINYCKDIKLIFEFGIKVNDPICHMKLIKYIMTNKQNEYIKRNINRLSNHKSTLLRKCYIEYICSEVIGDKFEALKNGLFDKSSGIREFSRFFIERDFNVKARDFYLEEINTDINQKVSIDALGDIGDVSDYDLLYTFFSSKILKIRLSSLKAVSKISFDRSKKILYEYLQSEVENESISARKILKKQHLDSEFLHIGKDLVKSEYSHIQKNIILLSNSFHRWESLLLLLVVSKYVYKDNVDILRVQLNICLCRLRNVYIKLEKEKKDELMSIFSDVKDKLDSGFRMHIEDILGRQ